MPDPDGVTTAPKKEKTDSEKTTAPVKEGISDPLSRPETSGSSSKTGGDGSSIATGLQTAMEEDSSGGGGGGGVTQGDIDQVQRDLAVAKGLVTSEDSPLNAKERAALMVKIATAESELQKYVVLQNQGSARTAGMAPLVLIGGGIIADDATVVGVADDPLLILVGLGMLGVWLFTSSSATDRALQDSWNGVSTALSEVIAAGTTIVVLRLNGDKLRGNTEQLAVHLARILGLAAAGGRSSGEPPKNNNDNDPHWWKEIKAFLKNIQQSIKGASRKQVMRELLRKGKFTEAQILEIERLLAEAAKLMGETRPPFLP